MSSGIRIIFKKICHSRLSVNVFSQFILTGFSYVVPIVLIPFLVSNLGIGNYGVVNLAIAFAFYFQVFNEWGFDLSNVRHVVQKQDNVVELGQFVSAVLQCKIILFCLSLLVYILLVAFIDGLYAYRIAYALAALKLLGMVLNVNWLFRSMEDSQYVAKIILSVKLLVTIPIFFIVDAPGDYNWVIFFFSFEAIVSAFVSLIAAKKLYHIRYKFVSLSLCLYYIKDSFPFFASTFFSRVYQTSNITVLGLVCGGVTAGLYSMIEKLHNAYVAFVIPLISNVMYPYFSRIRDFYRINKVVIAISSLNVLLLLALYFLSPLYMSILIKSNIEEFSLYFSLFLLLLSISIPVELLGFPYLGVMGFTNKVTLTTALTAFLYLLGLSILIVTQSVSIVMVTLLLLLVNIICLLTRIVLIKNLRTQSTLLR